MKRGSGGTAAGRISSVHRTPPTARLVDRTRWLLDVARGRRVIDLGFVDEGRIEYRLAEGTWLHAELAGVASSIVGVDYSEEGVALAERSGFEAYVADCTSRTEVSALGLVPAEVVIAGELIEHIDDPGGLLDAVRVLVADGGKLALTTPNGLSLTNFLGGLGGRELVNVDHVAWYSHRTLATLFLRHDWLVEDIAYYPFPQVAERNEAGARGHPLAARAFDAYQRIARPLFRVRPNLADGLVVLASPR